MTIRSDPPLELRGAVARRRPAADTSHTDGSPRAQHDWDVRNRIDSAAVPAATPAPPASSTVSQLERQRGTSFVVACTGDAAKLSSINPSASRPDTLTKRRPSIYFPVEEKCWRSTADGGFHLPPQPQPTS